MSRMTTENVGSSKALLRHYQELGALVGSAAGMIVGVVISGPYFFERSVWSSIGTILAIGAAGVVAGWLLVSVSVGHLAAGAGIDGDSGESGGGSDRDAGGGSGSGGGD